MVSGFSLLCGLDCFVKIKFHSKKMNRQGRQEKLKT
jgi:hypothetical protein